VSHQVARTSPRGNHTPARRRTFSSLCWHYLPDPANLPTSQSRRLTQARAHLDLAPVAPTETLWRDPTRLGKTSSRQVPAVAFQYLNETRRTLAVECHRNFSPKKSAQTAHNIIIGNVVLHSYHSIRTHVRVHCPCTTVSAPPSTHTFCRFQARNSTSHNRGHIAQGNVQRTRMRF